MRRETLQREQVCSTKVQATSQYSVAGTDLATKMKNVKHTNKREQTRKGRRSPSVVYRSRVPPSPLCHGGTRYRMKATRRPSSSSSWHRRTSRSIRASEETTQSNASSHPGSLTASIVIPDALSLNMEMELLLSMPDGGSSSVRKNYPKLLRITVILEASTSRGYCFHTLLKRCFRFSTITHQFVASA